MFDYHDYLQLQIVAKERLCPYDRAKTLAGLQHALNTQSYGYFVEAESIFRKVETRLLSIAAKAERP